MALEDRYEVISVNGLWPSDLADEFCGQCAIPYFSFYCLASMVNSTFI